MNWQQVGTIVATFAPTLGSLLGGLIPLPGGSLIGQSIGSAIAKQFGVPATPDAVAGAIKANPNEVVLAKLQAATEEIKSNNETIRAIFEAEAQLQARAFEAVNATMRAEKPHWFFTGWRAACGWLIVTFGCVFGTLLSLATIKTVGGDATALNAIVQAWPIYLAYFAALAAMVGVLIRNPQEKAAQKK